MASAAALLTPLPSAAQLFCTPAPKSVPRLNGAPRWLASDTTTTSTVSPWLNDPRLANSALTPYGATTDNAAFRVTYDNQYLIVSFQTPIALDDVADNLLDAVVFGVSDGTTARAVRVTLPAKGSNPADQPVALSGGFQYSKRDAAGTWTTSAANTAAPAWLAAPAAWVNEVRDGAAWGVNFKVNLNDLDETSGDTTNLRYAAGSKLRVTFGTVAVNSVNFQVVRQKAPDVALAGSQSWIFTNDQMVNSDPTTWIETDKTGDGCTGISLPRSSIGVMENGSYENPGNWLALNSTPTLVATPREPNPAYTPSNGEPEYLAPGDNTLAAKFRIAHWGSVAATAGWSALRAGSSTGPTEVNIQGGHFDFPCQPGTSTKTCGVTLDQLDPSRPGKSHQCMLVEMRPLLPNVNVSTASEYRNMHFETASTIDRVATIDVKGLQAITGNTSSREVYLYVRKRNMPPAGATKLELPRLDMFRARTEVTGEFTCSPSQTCMSGACATACQYPNNTQNPCGPNLQKIQTTSGCWCTPYENIKACLPPDPYATNDEPDLGDEQELAKIWPTIEVFPYWVTGKNVTMAGKVYKEMKPMSPFGMFVDHAGVYYGFTDAFAGTDVTVTKVSNNLYKLTIPNEGRKHVKMTVTAVEQAQSSQLLAEISGRVSNYGPNSTITLTAIAASTAPLDLSRATLTIEKLLVQGTNTELISNLPRPDVFPAFPFGLPFIALYGSTNGPPASTLVFDLPFIGRFTSTTVLLGDVARPAACGLFGGTVDLTTRFTINDGIHTPITFQGTDKWSCDLFTMWN